MPEEPEPLEDLAAGMLNGAMISLLGAAIPGALAWQMVTQWATWTADLRSVLVWDSLTGLGLLLVSFQILRVGLRLLWRIHGRRVEAAVVGATLAAVCLILRPPATPSVSPEFWPDDILHRPANSGAPTASRHIETLTWPPANRKRHRKGCSPSRAVVARCGVT